MTSQQNELSETHRLGVDIRGREKELLAIAQCELGFEPSADGLLGYSTWWNSERAGAFRYNGTYHALATSSSEQLQLKHALLGQHLGCLTISDLMIDPDHPMAEALTALTRRSITNLISELD